MLETSEVMAAKFYRGLCMAEVRQKTSIKSRNLYFVFIFNLYHSQTGSFTYFEALVPAVSTYFL